MFCNFEIKKMKESIIKALNYHYDISITALKNRVEGGEGNSNFFFSDVLDIQSQIYFG